MIDRWCVLCEFYKPNLRSSHEVKSFRESAKYLEYDTSKKLKLQFSEFQISKSLTLPKICIPSSQLCVFSTLSLTLNIWISVHFDVSQGSLINETILYIHYPSFCRATYILPVGYCKPAYNSWYHKIYVISKYSSFQNLVYPVPAMKGNTFIKQLELQ